MSQPYTHQVLKVVVAQICQTIGWHSIHSFPLELMVDILDKYIKELARSTHRYSELYNRTEPNLDDLGLAFKDLGINLNEVKEYIEFVDPMPCQVDVPKYPVPKDSHLNFLKPGSKEVLTRPMHVYEHLPPIHPEEEEKPIDGLDNSGECSLDGQLSNASEENASQPLFKKPSDPSSSHELSLIKRPRSFEEEGRPTREISSVMMTTSGFISPAREGKLPDSRPPVIPQEPKKSPPHVAASSTALPVSSLDGKFDKKIKKERKVDKDKKKEKAKDVKQEKMPPPPIISSQPPLPQASIPQPSPISKQPSPILSTPPPNMPSQILVSSTPKIEGDKHQNFQGLLPPSQQLLLTTPIKKSPKKREKKKLLQFMDGTTAPHPMEPKPKKQKLSKKQLQQQVFQQQMLQQPPNPPPSAALPPQIVGAQNYMDLLAGKSMALNSQTSIMPVPGPSSINMMQQFGNPFPSRPPQIDINPVPQKLTTEPDKQKLNIFKKMAKPTKDDVIIIDDDDIIPSLPKTPPNQMTKPPKMKPPKTPMDISQQPLNMSMNSKGNSFNSFSGESFSMNDFSPPKTPSALPKTPDIKMSSSAHWMPSDHGLPQMHLPMHPIEPAKKKERKPRTPKEKKVKQPAMPNWDLNSPFGQFSSEQNAANLTKFLAQSMNPMMQPGNPAANLLNMLQFTGPGLIPQGPSGPLMPGLQAMQRGGIPGFGAIPPGLGMGALDFLRLPMKKPQDFKSESSPPKKHQIEMAKPMCNVAPLIPPSLKIDDTPNKAAFLETSSFAAAPKPKPFIPDEPKVTHRPPSATMISTDSPPIKSFVPCDDVQIIEPVSKVLPKMPPKMEEIYKPVETPLPQTPPQQNKVQPVESRPSIIGQPIENRQVTPQPVIPPQEVQPMLLDEPPTTPEFNPDNVEKRKKDKEHKKDKKDKEGKVKKKKDKKDKNKSKERERDELGNEVPKKEKKKDKAEKERLKKEKKERKKERERQAASAAAMMSEGSNIFSVNSESKDHSDSSVGSVPRLTLKLGSTSSESPRPDTPDAGRKFTPNPFKHDEHSRGLSPVPQPTLDHPMDISHHNQQRDPSPELARISALVTRPPKQKGFPQNFYHHQVEYESPNQQYEFDYKSAANYDDYQNENRNNDDDDYGKYSPYQPRHFPQAPQSPLTPIYQSSANDYNFNTIQCGQGSAHKYAPILPPLTPNHSYIPPVMSIFPQSQNSFPINDNPQCQMPLPNIGQRKSSYIDAEGNEVWICPACGHLDDGTPMIGCDGCDAWYHWVCVGIQVPPDENEDWYCRVCITKKQESHGEKKKKRKKKDKKDH